MEGFAALLGAGFIGVTLLLLLLGFALVCAVTKRPRPRLVGSIVVFAVWLFAWYYMLTASERDESARERAFKPHADYFAKVCARAGVKVHRQIADVTSVAFQAPRSDVTKEHLWDQQFRGDVYGTMDTFSYATGGEWGLLSTFLTQPLWDNLFYPRPLPEAYLRYPQVEIQGTVGGVRGYFRYVAIPDKPGLNFAKVFVQQPASRYLVRWNDISTPEDRNHWVACSKWTIADLVSDEVIAERVGCAVDRAQGSRPSGPTGNAGEGDPPWVRAGHKQYTMRRYLNACPPKTDLYNLDFVRAALVPIQQEIRVTHPERR